MMFASFTGADLRKACFDMADLSGTNFCRASLAETRWRSARVVGVDIYNARNQKTGKVVYPRFEGADLTKADLRGAMFAGVDFASATMTGANLQGTDLRQCVGLHKTGKGS